MKPIILLLGSNEVSKKEFIQSLIQNISKDNIYNYYIDETEPEVIFSNCYQNSLFGDRNIIIIKNYDNSPENKKDKFLEALENYLNNYNPDNTLIISAEKIKDKIKNKIQDIGEIKEFKKFYKNDLINYINHKLKINKIKYDNDIPELIIDLANEDIEIIEKNLEIIIQYSLDKGVLTIDEVQSILSDAGNKNIFDFINGIFTKNIKLALTSLYDLKLNVDSITYITNMVYRTGKLLWIYISSNNKETALQELGIKFFEIKKLSEYAKTVDLKYLSKLFEVLQKIEIITKTMSEEFAYLEFEKFILTINK